jgi:hypothetical protein
MHDSLTRPLTALALLLSLAAATTAPATAAERTQAVHRPVLGDFAAEIRRPDGHIDVEANIRALKAMSANTYFYLIWHAKTDWEDLPAFAEAAEREGIQIWVYLIPWSETPLVKKSWGFSEPYRVDYVRWAKEVAKVSLKHRNVVGYVIDDFYTNSTQPDRFTVEYTQEMVDAGKAINPRLKFYPLVYFQQPWEAFMERFGAIVDGVVAAYPRSRVQVGNALAHLNDEPHGATLIVEYPKAKPSQPGDKGAISATLRVLDPDDATISFFWDDNDKGGERGFHTAFVRVDGKIAWEADTAGDPGDHVVEVDLAKFVRGRRDVRVELGLYERRGVTRYPVTARFDDIRLTGFDTPSELASEKLWRRQQTGAFTVDLQPSSRKHGRFNLPMILMPNGEAEQHVKRYPEPPTPENIAARVGMSLDLVRDGRVEGVVTYCLPKTVDDPTYNAVKREFRSAADDTRSASRR